MPGSYFPQDDEDEVPPPMDPASEAMNSWLENASAAAGVTPKDYGPGLDDGAIIKEQSRAKLSNDYNGILDAIYAAGTGRPVKPMGKADMSGVDTIFKQRAGVDKQHASQLAAEKARALAQKEAAENDPNSPDSVMVRKMISDVMPGIETQVPQFGKMSAGKAMKLFPFMREQMEAAQSKNREAECQRLAAEEAERKRNQELSDRDEKRKYEASQWEKEAALRRELAAAGANRTESNRNEDRKTHEDDKKEDRVERLSKQLPEGAGEFFTQDDELMRIINKPEHKGNIPGVFPGGNMAPGWAVGWLSGKDGQDLQKYARGMALAYRKLVTGTGGGEKELAAIDKAGLDLNDEDSFMAGLEALRNGYNARLKQVYAGYAPEIVKIYQSRGGVVPKEQNQSQAQKAFADKTGKIKVVKGTEKPLWIDPSDLSSAEADGYRKANP